MRNFLQFWANCLQFCTTQTLAYLVSLESPVYLLSEYLTSQLHNVKNNQPRPLKLNLFASEEYHKHAIS